MFSIQILTDSEFDRLPYRYVNEAIGCADPKTNTAYIRQSGMIGVDLLTIAHEVEELASSISPHEEDGIRYKKGKDIFKRIAPSLAAILAAPFTGGMSLPMAMLTTAAAAGGTRAITGAMGGERGLGRSALMSAIPGALAGMGMQPGVSAAQQAGQGYLSQLYQGGRTMIGMPQTAFSTAPGGIMQYAPASLMTSGMGGGITSTGIPPGFSPDVWSKISPAQQQGVWGTIGQARGMPEGLSSIMAAGTPINLGMGAGKTTGAWGTMTKEGLTNPLTWLGVGSMAMGQMATTAQPPSIGDIVGKWLTPETVTRAGARAKEIAETKYLGEFQPSKEIEAYMEVMEKDIRKAYTQRRTDMDRMGTVANEQWMSSGERLEMHRRLQEEEQGEVDKMQAQWLLTARQQYAQDQYNYVMSQLGADEQTRQELLYADLADVMWKYNLEREDVLNFRQMAADAGLYALSKGLGLA